MIGAEGSSIPNSPQARLSEVEVAQLLQKARQQYEEYKRLAALADISEPSEVLHPRYAWDNPLGLVVTGQANAKLV